MFLKKLDIKSFEQENLSRGSLCFKASALNIMELRKSEWDFILALSTTKKTLAAHNYGCICSFSGTNNTATSILELPHFLSFVLNISTKKKPALLFLGAPSRSTSLSVP